MNSTKVVLGSAAIILAAAALVSGASKFKNLSSKFKGSAGVPQNISLKGGNLSFNLPIEITNQSAFDVTLQNLYVTIQNRDNSGNWEDLFIQLSGIKQVEIKKLVTSRLANIPLSTGYTNAVKLLNLLSGKASPELKVTVRFDILSYELNPIEFILNAQELLVPFKSLLKSFGLGYADNSFHHRKITSADQYVALMPKSKGLESVIAQDAIPEETVKRMATIVKETLWQTKKLAVALEGNSIEESCKNIYDFLYNHIQYKRDADSHEQLREPIASFAHRESGIDCDCFSIFASSILMNMGINHYIKVISVRDDQQLQHVYVIVPKDGQSQSNYYTIDACLHSFNEEAKGITKEISEKMYTTRLSGLNQAAHVTAEPLPIAGLEGFFSAIKKAEKMPNKNAAVAKVTANASNKLTPFQTIQNGVQKSNMAVSPNGNITIINQCGAGKTCVAKPTPKVVMAAGTGAQPQQKQLRPFTNEELFKLSNVALEPVKNMLVDLQKQAMSNPATLSPLYDVQALKSGLTEVLSVWSEPSKRNVVLHNLSKNEVRFLNKDGLARNQLKAKGLLGIDGNGGYPIFGLDDAGNLATAKFSGGFFTSVMSMVTAIETNITKNARNAEAMVKAEYQQSTTVDGLFSKIGKAVSKASSAITTSVKKAANFVVENVQKVNPVMVLGRTAYRGLVALNFKGWATKIDKMRQSGTDGKLKDKWTGSLIGGNWGDLLSAVNAGKSKSALLGNLGEPVTIASSIAAATPVIAAVSSLISDAKDAVDKGKSVVQTVKSVKDMISTKNGVVVENNNSGPITYEMPGSPSSTNPNNSSAPKSNTMLYAALAILVAGGIGYAVMSKNSEPKSKQIGELAAVTKAKKVIKSAKI